MRKIILCMALSFAMVFGFSVSSHAILILSGDGNITTDLPSGVYDNGQFFTNVLEGGSNVAVLNETGWGGAENFDSYINNYYNSLTGVSSTLISGITAASLSGADLFVAVTPDAAFTGSELIVLDDFYTGGGSIFFLGENSAWDDTSNNYINDALAFLGSDMSIVYGSTFDTGLHVATGTQINSDALTAGVLSFQYAAPDQVNITGGTYLFYGTLGQPFVSYEGAATVPEPATLLLLGSGLIGLAFARRKKKS